MPLRPSNKPFTLFYLGSGERPQVLCLDEVTICFKTLAEHRAHVREVLQLFQMAGVTLKLAKCTFFDTAVSGLGHTVLPGQLQVDKRNLVPTERATAPTNETELRYLLGMCNLYRRFVPGFAKIAAPLSKMTGEG